jgi:hypothetical protein
VKHVAHYITTTLPSPGNSERVLEFRREFIKAIPIAYQESVCCSGFVKHANQIDWDDSKSEFDQDYGAWGQFAVPRWYKGSRQMSDRDLSQSFSIWVDLESVYAYAYEGTHGDFMRRSRSRDFPEWRIEFKSVAWWIEPGSTPTWEEAVERLHFLCDHGSSGQGFDARHPFDEWGQPTVLNPAKLREIRGYNREQLDHFYQTIAVQATK